MGTAEIIMAVQAGIRLLIEVVALVDADPNRTIDPADREALRAKTRELLKRAEALV